MGRSGPHCKENPRKPGPGALIGCPPLPGPRSAQPRGGTGGLAEGAGPPGGLVAPSHASYIFGK